MLQDEPQLVGSQMDGALEVKVDLSQFAQAYETSVLALESVFVALRRALEDGNV